MIAGASCGQWAQSGFWHDPVDNGGAYVMFAQYNNGDCGSNCTSPCVNKWGPITNGGQNHQYWQDYVTDSQCPSSCEALNVDVTNFLVTPFNIFASWSQPISNQFLGEVGNLATDMPGNPADGYATYTQMQWQETNPGQPFSGYDTNFYTSPYYNNGNIYRWTHDSVVNGGGSRGNAMDIWTYYEYTP
jgi:hypothetical protein